MSIYLPRVSERIRRVSLVSRNELRLKALMARIQTLTRANVFLAVAVLNLLCRHKKQKTLQLAPLVLLRMARMVTELELVPISLNKPYLRPVCVFRDGTARRNARGAITDVLYVEVDRFYTCLI